MKRSSRTLRVAREIGERGLVVVIVIGLWQLATVNSDSVFFPTPFEIFDRLGEQWLSGSWATLGFTSKVGESLVPSLARLAPGLAVAVIGGITIGALIGLSRELRPYLDPIIEFLRSIPPPAIVPICLIAFGISDTMRVVVIVFGVVWPIVLNTVEGVRSVDSVKLDVARVFGIGRVRAFFGITLPAAMPKIFAALQLSLSLGLIMMVLSEFVSGNNGLGFDLVLAQQQFRIVDMWGSMIVLVIVGYILLLGLTLVEKRVLGWHVGERRRPT